MGCDIHAMVEVRIDPYNLNKSNPDDGGIWGWWIGAGEVFIDRDYELFASLAGVRSRTIITPIARGRGIPEGASEVYRAWVKMWGDDAHNHSWVTVEELETIAKLRKGLSSASTARKLAKTAEALAKIHGASDVRLAFFFDN